MVLIGSAGTERLRERWMRERDGEIVEGAVGMNVRMGWNKDEMSIGLDWVGTTLGWVEYTGFSYNLVSLCS